MMERLLQLPFAEEEERELISFLLASDETKNLRGAELLVMYFLQRGRLTEALQLNNTLQNKAAAVSTECKEICYKLSLSDPLSACECPIY